VNSLPDAPTTFTNGCDVSSLGDERVEDYLDHICGPLVGVLPYEHRAGLREEIRLHLDGLIAEFEEQGKTSQVAAELAFREMGEPWQLGEAILREWGPEAATTGAHGLLRTEAIHAFAWFGPPTVLCLLLTDLYVLYPRQEAALPLLFLIALLAPFVSGILTGISAPVRAGHGVCLAVSVLSLVALVAGLLLWPKTEGLLFALFQWVYWTPAGWVSASVAASTARQHRRLRFLRLAR
jgi:hypothetical protein